MRAKPQNYQSCGAEEEERQPITASWASLEVNPVTVVAAGPFRVDRRRMAMTLGVAGVLAAVVILGAVISSWPGKSPVNAVAPLALEGSPALADKAAKADCMVPTRGSGTCIDRATCTGTPFPGFCPGAANIQCCVVPATRCTTPDGRSGSCLVTATCGGDTFSGLCPGPADVKCCAFNGQLTEAQLRAVMPSMPEAAVSYLPYINAALEEGNMQTCLRASAFLAQAGHESGSLRWMEELGTGEEYEGRTDLGNTQPGDGRRYKGRGPFQLTGRANYHNAGKALGLDLEGNPTLAADPEVGFRVAVWFWNTRGLSPLADQGTQSAFDTITRRINGGLNGKPDRDSRWAKAKAVLGC